MNLRSAIHSGRDLALIAASKRPFQPLDSNGREIVVVRPDHFGDLLMLAPALHYLAAEAPDHHITLMIGPWNEEVARHLFPELNILTFPFPGFVRAGTENGVFDPYRDLFTAAELLRERKPAAILLARNDHWWGAWMAREAGAPLRIGYSDRRLARFLSHPLDIDTSHNVQQNLELVNRSLALLGYRPKFLPIDPLEYPIRWPVDEISAASARELQSSKGLRPESVYVHPGTGAPVKRWPVERWARVIDRIATETGQTICLTGAPDERNLCNEIQQASESDPVNLAGETSLFTLAELFRNSKLVLGVDSGPLHLATAVGVPTIHLYGPSDPVRYGPWGDPNRNRMLRVEMSCPECGNLSEARPTGCGCMTSITVTHVAETAIEMLRDDH